MKSQTPCNLEILNFSIQNPESHDDIAYSKGKNSLVISQDPKNPETLQRANTKLKDYITTLSVLSETKKQEDGTEEEIIEKMMTELKTKNINFSEFVSYWAVNDISYSQYKNFPISKRRTFLKKMILLYIADRDALYKKYGYSDVSLQTKSDSAAHKKSGNLGLAKVSTMLAAHHFKKIDSIEEWDKADFAYVLADKDGKNLATKIIAQRKIKFTWQKSHAGKSPDFVVKVQDHLFIVEHKHMKEAGGGQDKNILEIITFIGESENLQMKTSYISFLDGVLFNSIFAEDFPTQKKSKKTGKVQTHSSIILTHLKKNPNNFFVNTAGFEKLLETWKKQ